MRGKETYSSRSRLPALGIPVCNTLRILRWRSLFTNCIFAIRVAGWMDHWSGVEENWGERERMGFWGDAPSGASISTGHFEQVS